jgi:hypothetical protein
VEPNVAGHLQRNGCVEPEFAGCLVRNGRLKAELAGSLALSGRFVTPPLKVLQSGNLYYGIR